MSIAHKPGAGREITYPDEQFLAILERYAQGENLLQILDADGMPDWATFWRRCCGPNASDELRTAYADAQVSWATRAVHEVPHIADTVDPGEERTTSSGPKGDTLTVKTIDRLGHRQLRVNTRQWFAERLLAKHASKTVLMNPDGTPLAVPAVSIIVRPPEQEKPG